MIRRDAVIDLLKNVVVSSRKFRAVVAVIGVFTFVALLSGFDNIQTQIAFFDDRPRQEAQAEPEAVDVIKNGDFEKPWEFMNGVAPDWNGYHNGQAHFGWYEETWAEAVRKGQGHAQLMEIFQVEANVLDRVIAVYQTVDVAPNAEYDLTIYAIMRTDAPEPLRNKSEYEMHWGIDPWGEGNYDNVEQWNLMPLNEQNRIGSTAPYPEDIPLVYERITSTIRTGPNTNSLTLFIRGLKKFPNGTEVNFDVDDVSLIGPAPNAVIPAAQGSQNQDASAEFAPDETTSPESAPAEDVSAMPATGATLTLGASVGTFVLGGLVLVIITTAAAAHLLEKRKIT